MIQEKVTRADGVSGLKIIKFLSSDVSPSGILVIPDDTVIIGENATDEIKHLVKYVKFNEKLESIQKGAFAQCELLKDVILPNGVKFIGEKAFWKCKALREISVNVVTIENFAFCGCRNLKTISLGNEIKKIGDYGFAETGIITLNLPHTLYSLGMGAFKGCQNLVSLTIGGNIGQIPLLSFKGCIALNTVFITANLEKIQTKAFKDCTHLSTLQLTKQNSIKICETAFVNCEKLSCIKTMNEEYVLPEPNLIYSILSQTDTE